MDEFGLSWIIVHLFKCYYAIDLGQMLLILSEAW